MVKINYFNPFNLNSLCQECTSKSDIIIKFPKDDNPNELVGLCIHCYNEYKKDKIEMKIIQKR